MQAFTQHEFYYNFVYDWTILSTKGVLSVSVVQATNLTERGFGPPQRMRPDKADHAELSHAARFGNLAHTCVPTQAVAVGL